MTLCLVFCFCICCFYLVDVICHGSCVGYLIFDLFTSSCCGINTILCQWHSFFLCLFVHYVVKFGILLDLSVWSFILEFGMNGAGNNHHSILSFDLLGDVWGKYFHSFLRTSLTETWTSISLSPWNSIFMHNLFVCCTMIILRLAAGSRTKVILYCLSLWLGWSFHYLHTDLV